MAEPGRAALPAASLAGAMVAHAGQALGQRLAGAALALVCAALAAWLALHHPLSPALALAGVLLLAALQCAWPPLWLLALPALLPWIGLGAWTGWLVVEEVDLAVLAVAAGGWLGWALRPGPRLPASRLSRRHRAWGLLLLGLWTVSVAVSAHRGVVGAGGWAQALDGGWWQGWREPLAALRQVKPVLAVWLLLPLWWRLQQRPGVAAGQWLAWGLAAGLAGTSLWCVWERAAFPGLLNMATDHRTTGPFWETHVGGAALDAMLTLCLPFALHLWAQARRPLALGALSLLLLAAAYAGLTTFSRIVYLSMPLAAALWWWLWQRQQRAGAAPRAAAATPGAAGASAPGWPLAETALVAGIALLGAWMFPTSGYRGLLALLGNALVLRLLLAAAGPGQGVPSRPVLLAVWAAGLGAAVPLGWLALQIGKGPYLLYAAVTVAAAALLVWPARGALLGLAVALSALSVASTAAVALGWGGNEALPAAAGAAGALAIAGAVALLRGQGGGAPELRPAIATTAVLAVVLAGVAVFRAGGYMSERLQQSEADSQGRQQHWQDGLSLIGSGSAWLLGEGLGRYPDLYAVLGRPETRPGDIRWVGQGDAPHVRMVAGLHPAGSPELLRLSQRIERPAPGPLQVQIELRAERMAELVAEVCGKHLLYPGNCRDGAVRTTTPGSAAGEGWQTLTLLLKPQAEATAGEGWESRMPRFIVFSLALQTGSGAVDVRRIALTDATGQVLLHNGDFQRGLARWFITSDRNHLPWHAKNLGVHLLVEQGLLGLAAMALWWLAALAGLLRGLHRHPLAPPLAAALVGWMVVGSVDSMLDLPRTATWGLLLLAMASSLHLPSSRLAAGAGAEGARHGPRPGAH